MSRFEKRILVYGTMGDIGDIVLKSLVMGGYDAVKVDFPQNTWRDEFGYRRTLMHAVREYHPGMIVPVGNLRAMSRIKMEYAESGIIIPVEDESKIGLLDSKTGASAIAAGLGIPQPRIYSDPEDAVEMKIIFKRDKSFGGSGVYKPKNKDSLLNLMNQEKGSKFLIEDYIEGEDYSLDALRWGTYFRAGCYKSLSKRGQGPAQVRQKEDCPELCAYARKILDSLDFNGVCGMDFRRDPEGNYYFLECNPRFTGGLQLQIESGFDIPCLLARLASGEGV